MATVVRHLGHTDREVTSRAAARSRPGQDDLAKVIMIRAGTRRGLCAGSQITVTQVFASLRHQATSVRSAPRPPSSPAPLCSARPRPPHDHDAA